MVIRPSHFRDLSIVSASHCLYWVGLVTPISLVCTQCLWTLKLFSPSAIVPLPSGLIFTASVSVLHVLSVPRAIRVAADSCKRPGCAFFPSPHDLFVSPPGSSFPVQGAPEAICVHYVFQRWPQCCYQCYPCRWRVITVQCPRQYLKLRDMLYSLCWVIQ